MIFYNFHGFIRGNFRYYPFTFSKKNLRRSDGRGMVWIRIERKIAMAYKERMPPAIKGKQADVIPFAPRMDL